MEGHKADRNVLMKKFGRAAATQATYIEYEVYERGKSMNLKHSLAVPGNGTQAVCIYWAVTTHGVAASRFGSHNGTLTCRLSQLVLLRKNA
jgi:hypothetical protein